MKILSKKRVSSNLKLTKYIYGIKKTGFLKSLFIKNKDYAEYWYSLIECFLSVFNNYNVELFLEVKHSLGAFEKFENEYNEILKTNPIYYSNDKKFIVLKDINSTTLKSFIHDYYDQGLIILISKERLNNHITDELIKMTNDKAFSLESSIEKGIDIAIQFSFPSGKQICLISNIDDEILEKCFNLTESISQ